MKRSSSFPTWVVFLSPRPPLTCPRGWVKADKTPKYSVKHGRPLPCGLPLQCFLGNYGNNSAVRGEARGPGMTRSTSELETRGVAELEVGWQGQGKADGARLSLAHKPCCHIRGRWMYVGSPSDLSSSTIKMLMRDDDKCLSSLVICTALTDRHWHLVRWSAGRSKCAIVWVLVCGN